MSSRESYAEKRADLINYITDQIVYGVYRTEHEQVKTTDPLTQQEKTVDIVRPKIDPKSPNGVLREEESPIQRFGMSANNITVNSIDYDAVVEVQIKQQQEAINAVQQAIVNSKKAEQDAITVELQGKAAAAKAKWDQEVQKATAVTVAEQEKAVAVTQATKNKEVAALSLDTARLSAQETVTTAKAEADAKRLAMQSDNYQAKKIEATVEIQKAWAAAYGAQPQVPSISMGSSSSPTSTAMDAVAVRALRELNK
jgi:hypothetical protein